MKKYLKKLNIQLVKGEFKNPIKGQVREPEQVFSIFKDMKDWAKETALGVYLDSDCTINSYEVHSVGGEDVSLILPHEIFRSALLTKSRYFILIHNHPSGIAMPSNADKEVLQDLKAQAEIMRCYMLDFIIVGGDSYWSMFEEEEGGDYTLGAFL